MPPATSRQPVHLDVDTGCDDALALMLAALHPRLDLRSVTCVGGNAPLDDVVRNTVTVLSRCGRYEVPVGAGADRPLLEAPSDARHVHGSDGMAGLSQPMTDLLPGGLEVSPALEVLAASIDTAADEGRPLTVVPLAPMTNLALLARINPAAFGRIGRIVFMGGGAHVSNATAAAEFNVFHDPESAAIVLDACAELGVPVTMYGLDVFYAPTVSRADADRLEAAGEAGVLAAGIVRFLCDRFEADTATIGDAGAVALLLAPDAVRTERLPVRVELAGTYTRGRTIVDTRDWNGDMDHDPHGLAPAQVEVALEVDGPRLAGLWLDTVLQRAAR